MSYIRQIDEKELETGDLLLFHGKTSGWCWSCALSFLIECCTHSKFSHSGIVIKDPKFTPEPLQGLYFLESTGLEKVKDVEDHQVKFGVQLRKLDEVLKDSGDDIYLRKLKCQRDEAFYKRLAEAHSVVHNRPYDVLDYISVFLVDDLKAKLPKLQRKNTFFCSALCAYLYVCWGFLPTDTDWSLVTPHDLSTEPDRTIRLKFKNCILEREVKI